MALTIPSPSPRTVDAVFQYTNGVMMPEVIKLLLVLAGLILVFAVWRGFKAA